MSRTRPTIREVAQHAGVSHQTVSRVINHSTDVLPETRAKVESAIAELGFRPSAIARSMAQGKTNTLACIAPNLTDYTFASVIEGAELEARKNGYFLLSSSADDPQAFQDLVEELVGHRRVDGLIVINPYIDDRFQSMPENFPMVLVGARSRDERVCSISLDDEKAAYDATNHLIQLGHHNIAMVTGPMEEDCSRDRSNGYIRALEDHNIQVDLSMVIEGDWSADAGQNAFHSLSRRGLKPTAVFAQNDRMALGVLHAAREMHLAIPGQLAVIGVDDMPLSSYFDPPLTTMHQDMPRIGKEATGLLIKAIDMNGEKCAQIKFTAQLVVRESTQKGGVL
jgi:LacI family transcriptional regulator, repressor for deo operon, udp, cdd, tsx, nupC, and nupG